MLDFDKKSIYLCLGLFLCLLWMNADAFTNDERATPTNLIGPQLQHKKDFNSSENDFAKNGLPRYDHDGEETSKFASFIDNLVTQATASPFLASSSDSADRATEVNASISGIRNGSFTPSPGQRSMSDEVEAFSDLNQVVGSLDANDDEVGAFDSNATLYDELKSSSIPTTKFTGSVAAWIIALSISALIFKTIN
ncbi:uncharacterized protein PHALS_07749 [Plasmopara halstedii]|uniref:RxLR-like protein n=1 Tax=Plasmopara halstedii TaxID=4781 RepID=A0A0N7L8J1_PLAHL|nr:uncharacterized protein PHALS_07749 [Plasmopara halstedii]CEG50019.1 hypothetical protein PHALS_07749 [Plasmopara halstedii]|eukprot:XP_024586388.1 hypothetical protein PHALS_07749 [Plasmopara halstedii]